MYAPDGVADFTLMLILMAIRNAKEIVSAARATTTSGCSSVRGKDLRDLTVGVVGVGQHRQRRHQALARIRMPGAGVQQRPRPAAAAEFVPLDDLLLESDVVTLHVPLNAETHHLIGRQQIETMKQGAFLVNTGRGALVDTDALIVALEARKAGRRGVGRAGG